ncbi:uncharacterized protein LOC143064398 isoform X2 [Mytilus galloprovincialis]|uniref:uncharacterized protein LOC143064398 isoform X2 n=1 Tax=Mytilus galloprovincialis TaxID=29158 RepID=UPI003F7C9112
MLILTKRIFFWKVQICGKMNFRVLQLCFVKLIFVNLILGYPNGAPRTEDSCLNLQPIHSDPITNQQFPNQQGPAPFRIELSTGVYQPCVMPIDCRRAPITVTIRGLSRYFRGFIIQARTEFGGVKSYGKFIPLGNMVSKTVACQNGQSLTHSNNNDRTVVQFQWLPEPNMRETFRFISTVVQDLRTIYTDVMSTEISPTGIVRQDNERKTSNVIQQPPSGPRKMFILKASPQEPFDYTWSSNQKNVPASSVRQNIQNQQVNPQSFNQPGNPNNAPSSSVRQIIPNQQINTQSFNQPGNPNNAASSSVRQIIPNQQINTQSFNQPGNPNVLSSTLRSPSNQQPNDRVIGNVRSNVQQIAPQTNNGVQFPPTNIIVQPSNNIVQPSLNSLTNMQRSRPALNTGPSNIRPARNQLTGAQTALISSNQQITNSRTSMMKNLSLQRNQQLMLPVSTNISNQNVPMQSQSTSMQQPNNALILTGGAQLSDPNMRSVPADLLNPGMLPDIQPEIVAQKIEVRTTIRTPLLLRISKTISMGVTTNPVTKINRINKTNKVAMPVNNIGERQSNNLAASMKKDNEFRQLNDDKKNSGCTAVLSTLIMLIPLVFIIL